MKCFRAVLLVISLLMVLGLSTVVQAEIINISVASSMTDAFKDIVEAFQDKNPNVSVRANFAGSGSLAKQINQGAPADLYVSANPKWMKFLVGNKMISQGTDKIFAYNKLVFAGKYAGNNSLDMNKLMQLERIAIGSPKSVPAGQYAREAMENSGVYGALVDANKLVLAKDVRQALLYADRQEVDGAFVYRTDALLAKNAQILFTVPDNLYSRVSYPLALTVAGAKKKGAKALYDFMAGDSAVRILERYGFAPVK